MGDLRSLIGDRHLFFFEQGHPFSGELLSLEGCTSTVGGLTLLRDWPALLGVMRIYPNKVNGAVQ